MKNKKWIVFLVYLLFAAFFSFLIGAFSSNIDSMLITFVVLLIFGVIVYRIRSKLELILKPLIGKLLSIIQTHGLIFAIAFTFLIFVWFIHPKWLVCGSKGYFNSCPLPDELGWLVITVIWLIVMVWLFCKRQDS